MTLTALFLGLVHDIKLNKGQSSIYNDSKTKEPIEKEADWNIEELGKAGIRMKKKKKKPSNGQYSVFWWTGRAFENKYLEIKRAICHVVDTVSF